MVTEKELLEAIRACEQDPITYANIEKLANLYTVHHYLYGVSDDYPQQSFAAPTETVIGKHGDSEFLTAVDGMDASAVWSVIDELMETVRLVNPRLYDGVLRKLDK